MSDVTPLTEMNEFFPTDEEQNLASFYTSKDSVIYVFSFDTIFKMLAEDNDTCVLLTLKISLQEFEEKFYQRAESEPMGLDPESICMDMDHETQVLTIYMI